MNIEKEECHMFAKTINGHTKKEMKKRYAGKYITNPEQLPNGTNVTVFEKDSNNWWEHGEIYTKKDGSKAIDCYDGEYLLNNVEVYLDTRYIHKL